MKHRLTITFALLFALFLVACGGAAPEPAPEPVEEPAEEVMEEEAMDEEMDEEDMEEEAMDEEMEEEAMEEEMVPSIAEIAVADGSFTILVAALDAAGLVETLSGEGAFTVFAPTDDAFAALPEGTVEALLEDPEGALTDILLYHVVDGAVMAETVVTLESATTLNGADVSINAEDGVVLNDSVNVVATDIEASNGVIHVIDAVLLPPADDEMMEEDAMMEEPTMSIAEIAVADGSFNTLVAALDAAGLVETLSGEGEFTVFAPTDDAFAALPEGTVESLLEDPEGALTDILLYHVVDGTVKAETVVTLESATTLNGADVSINAEDGVVLNDSVNVVVTDIAATNGVIHVIDAVLLPPADEEMMDDDMMMEEPILNIAETAIADGNFTTLVAALAAADLVETLSGEGEFTVFAPTDDAFAALPEGTVEALLEDPSGALTDILLYHVVEGVVKAEDVVALESATTMLWQDISIAVTDDGVVLNDSVNVIATDIMATNGVIHVIDAVLLPPADDEMMDEESMDDVELISIAEIASTSEDFETLTAALTAAGLVDTLAGEGEFTVFAPTDDAFAALPEGTVESLLEDPEGALTDILLYHVAEGTVTSDVVVTLESAPTLNGADVTIAIDDDGNVVLNDSAKVVLVDVKASNGVIHVIDMVLLPPAE